MKFRRLRHILPPIKYVLISQKTRSAEKAKAHEARTGKRAAAVARLAEVEDDGKSMKKMRGDGKRRKEEERRGERK